MFQCSRTKTFNGKEEIITNIADNIMPYLNINDLEKNIRRNVEELDKLVDILIAEYRSACDIIDETIDHRKKYLDQLTELDDTLSNLVSMHPAMHVDAVWSNAMNCMSAIAKCRLNSGLDEAI